MVFPASKGFVQIGEIRGYYEPLIARILDELFTQVYDTHFLYYCIMSLLFGKECYQVLGACMEVHSELGSGFLESVYADALDIEMKFRKIPAEKKKKFIIKYKGEPLLHYYKADLVAFNEIIVELKAVKQLENIHTAQTINYLKASKKNVALLVNFGQESLEYKRLVYGLKP